MTYSEAVDYIETQGWSTTRLGLSRTRELLQRLGNPQKKLRFVHVAGSNGKGSCCAMTASVLRAAGLTTGLYISPHLVDFCERMSVNGQEISHEELAEITARVAGEADAMEDHPSQFELSTAIAMLFFREKNCDIVVLEVGMGGRLDSTNAIDAPEVAVIMNIGLEHTEYLGNTLPEIAAQKAGIIKPGCSAVFYGNVPEVLEVICDTCDKCGVNLRTADFDSLSVKTASFSGQTFIYKGREYFIPLAGAHQAKNAAVVLEIVSALRERGFSISEEAVRAGLGKAVWPARGELLSESPFFLLDGGHNPQCASVLSAMLKEYLPGEEVVFLIGLLRDKDRKTILETLSPVAASFICLTPESDRAMPAEELAAEIRQETGKSAVACDSVSSGIALALGTDEKVVAFGSLYLAGYIRTAFFPALKKHLRKRCTEARRDLLPAERAEKSHAICEQLKSLPSVQQAKCIFSYLAAPDEVNLREFNAWAVSQGKRVCFPVCASNPKGATEIGGHSKRGNTKSGANLDKGGSESGESPQEENSLEGADMDAYIPENPEAIEQGPFGIYAPVVSRAEKVLPEEIDLILLPCVGFDAGGGRLGHGAGYYDRYLLRLGYRNPSEEGTETGRDVRRPAALLVAFEAQKLQRCPMDVHDVPVQAALTEKNLYKNERSVE